jgi:IMP dehydrogenase/GMP reductase
MNLKELLQEGLTKGFIRQREEKDYFFDPRLDIPETLEFGDVRIDPAESKCSSRLKPNLRSEFVRGMYLDIPLIASNMLTVVNAEFCNKLYELGALGVMHRAWLDEEQYIKEIQKMCGVRDVYFKEPEHDIIAASIGVGNKLYRAEVNLLFIDVANGFSNVAKETAIEVKKCCPFIKIVVGNTTNIKALQYFDGVADAIKIGIGSGANCETKNVAGATKSQFSAVLELKEEAKRLGMPIISDGGTREPGDFAKSMGAGASAVMAGSIFARCPESNAPFKDGKKLQAGMASRWVQERWKGGLKPGTCPEGKVTMLDVGESVDKLVERYAGALRSAITYTGATDIQSFQEKVKFTRVK